MTEKRLLVVFILFTAFAFLIEWNMVYINVNGKYFDQAQNQQYKEIYIDDSRGAITDSSFRKITNTTTQYKTLVTPYDEDLQQVFDQLTEEERKNFYNNLKSKKSFLAEIQAPIEGRKTYVSSLRYSDFNIAQHIIGYTNDEGNGVTGIEKAFNQELQNSAAMRYLQMNINGYGQIIQMEEKEKLTNDSGQSSILALTLDNTIQRLCEGIAKEYIPNGSIVVMESKTGKIKAMVSTPFYSANDVASALKDENSPLLNKSVQAYEPGSVIKPLWAAVLAENGYNPSRTYECTGVIDVNGHEYHCANNNPHGPVDMQRALVVSCNCYFVNAFIQDKAFRYSQMGNNLNFGSSLELARNFYTSAGYFPSYEELSNLGQLATVSFGQGKMLLTPVHVAAYMNIFANNGIYVAPQITQGIYNADTEELITNLYAFNQKQVITPETAALIKPMLQAVVEEGARQRAKPAYFSAGGKTGTAQTGKFNPDETEILTAWFCGFYPYDNPQYTICVTMYNGGESTYTATPVFKKICDSLYYIL